MDEAFLTLLGKKDFAYITVKEICAVAGVNRSTFYLHYETMADLLSESVNYMNQQFLSYMQKEEVPFLAKIDSCPIEDLYLVTPEYLAPYLSYIEQHKKLFQTALDNVAVLELNKNYEQLFSHVLAPILNRYQVPEQDRNYLMAFYIQGLMAIITEWLKHDCSDSAGHIIQLMQQCVKRSREG